jgi:hypothetical protein
MRAAKFILFGILLVLLGVYAPNAVVGLLYSNMQPSSTSITNLLGANSFYVYLAQVVLMALGFVIGLVGLFVIDPPPVAPIVDLRANIPFQGYQGYQPTPPPPDFR